MLNYLLSFVIGSQYNLLPPPSSWSASRARIIEYALCPYFSRKMLREVFALASFTVKIRASSHACASSSGTRCSYVLPVCVCVYIYMCVYIYVYMYVYIHRERERVRERERERESLLLIIGYTVLIRLACVCVCTYISSMCVMACATSSGTRCSYVLPVPRLVLPRLAYHVEHQDKRIRRGVGVRAGGSQGRRELQVAAENELATERCAIRRN